MENELLRESKQHGAARFPFNIYPCSIPGDFPQVALHWQNSMELVSVKRGRGVIQAGLTQWQAQAAEIYVFPPGTLHAIRQASGGSMEYENIIFELSLLGDDRDLCAERYLLPLQSGRMALPARLTPCDSVYPSAAACLREAEIASRDRPIGYELAIKGALLRFLALLVAQSPALPAPETQDTRRLKLVLHLIDTRYTERLQVADAAAVCGCSAGHFMRWFKKMTGCRFTVYLNDRRLRAAAEALRASDDTVLAIAEQNGFDNLSYFNRLFRQRYGVPPREYRRQ